MATIEQLEKRVAQLEQMVLQIARGNVNTIGKVDDTSNKVDDTSNRVTALTPYTETKTAYILDTEIVFNSVPQGNLSVFFSIPTDYTISRVSDSVVISFEPLEEVTEVTISIQ